MPRTTRTGAVGTVAAALARPASAPEAALDVLDRRIIAVLQQDGRRSNTDVARQIGVTETTIRKRIKRLLDTGLIQVVAIPSPAAREATMSAIIGLSVNLSVLREVSQRLRSYPEVRYVGMSSGRYDAIVEAFFTDHEHLLAFITERVGTLEGVTGIETSIILKVVKFSWEWDLGS